MIWQTKKLGEVLKLEYGKPLPKSRRSNNGRYPVYGANGIKSWTNSFYCGRPTIIIGRKGSAGEINFTEEKFWPLDVTYFVTFDEKKYDLKFLYNLLVTLELPKLAKGVKPGINRNDVYVIEVQIPPLPEQYRIVKILDEVFADVAKAKENAEKNLQNAKELFESYLQNVFANPGDDWEKKRLGEICEKTSNINWQNYKKEKFKYIDLSAVSRNNLKIVSSVLIDCGNAPSRAKKIIKKNDIIFATTRPTLKRIARIFNEYDDQVCSTGFVILRANKNKIFPEIIFYFFQTLMFMENMAKLQRGTSYPAVSDSDVKNQIISFPKSLTTQKQIVKKLDSLSASTKKLEKNYQRKIDDLEELKKSVLKEAFNREL